MKRPMIVAAVALLLTAVGPESARAAGKGHRSKTYTTATLIVSPNPVPLGSTGITVTGSGFAANQIVYLEVSGWIPWPSVTTDASGSFSYFYSHLYTGTGNSFVKAWVNGAVVAIAYYTVQ